MRSPLLKMVLAVIVLGAAFALCFALAQRARVKPATEADELAWLQTEFHLSHDEMVSVRRLHEGYMPKCEEMCARIAQKNRELDEVLAQTTNVSPVVEQKLAEAAALRAECQAHMLKHFYEVSHAMPPEQGARYLAEMKRKTLGLHSRQEEAMTGTNAPRHAAP